VAWWQTIATPIANALKAWVDKHAQASAPRLVTIGTVARYTLTASLRAEVKPAWQRWYQPDVETFLEWVQLGRCYCGGCQSTMAPRDDQQGLLCRACGTHAGTEDIQQLQLQLTGEIRRHYADYWARYQQATASWFDTAIVKTWVKWRSTQGATP
jgi:uncharacterized paraquat-inducible protein A